MTDQSPYVETTWKRPFKDLKGKWYARETEKLIKNCNFGKYICFTYYGEDEPKWKPETMHYLVFQRETCPETKRLHWQGYVEFKHSNRLYTVWDELECHGARCANRKAPTGEQAAAYCKKTETAIAGSGKEYGTIHGKGRGFRTDLFKVAEAIKGGASETEIATQYPDAVLKYHRGLAELRKLTTPELKVPMPEVKLYPWQETLIQAVKNFKPFECRRKIWWIHGPHEIGKTTTIRILQSTFGLATIGLGDIRWDDMIYAYKGEKVLVFNLPKAQDLNSTLMSVLERASDGGVVLSRKYESKQKWLDALVIVFSNQPCPETELTKRCIKIDLTPPELVDKMQDHDESKCDGH